MSGLRAEIRAILREEFAALRAESTTPPPLQEQELVCISSSADLTRFARDVITRASDPAFAEKVSRGELCFELAQTAPIGMPIVSGTSRPAPNVLDKTLITERDITGLDSAFRSLRIAPQARLTPLARDEARRRGIRIERSET